MSHGRSSVYPSKRDGWIVLILWVTASVMMLAAHAVWREPAPLEIRLALSALFIGVAGFVLWLLYGTGYTLTDELLHIRSGPFRWRVKLDAINEVVPTRNPLSSPACSLDRLRIRYRGARFGIMISPRDKNRFLRDLASRDPGLNLADGRMVRERV